MTKIKFNPTPNQKIRLFDTDYYVQTHPEAEYMAFVSEGKKANVVQLKDTHGDLYALKKFKKAFRTDEIIGTHKHLTGLQAFPGMKAAKRQVISPDNPIVEEFYDLEYAVLMPWLKGQTWFDILHKFRLKEFEISKSQAITVCKNFLAIMTKLESAVVAHTDISSGNVMIDFENSDVQLLDLEDIYITGMPQPNKPNIGTIGYQHRSCEKGQSYWCAEGDRYSAAVLASEILLLSNPDFADLVKESSFFQSNIGDPNIDEKYQHAKNYLRSLSPKFAAKFDLAWRSEKLQHCNPLENLYSVVSEMERNLKSVKNQAQSKKPKVPPKQDKSKIVSWSNLPITNPTPTPKKPIIAVKPPIAPVSKPSPSSPYWSTEPSRDVKIPPPTNHSKFLGVGIGVATTIFTLTIGFIVGLFFIFQNYPFSQSISNSNKNNLNVNIPANIANNTGNSSTVNTTTNSNNANSNTINQNSNIMQNTNVNKSNSTNNTNSNSNLNKSSNSLASNSAYYDWCVMYDNSPITNDNNITIGKLNRGDRIKKIYQDTNDKRWFFIESPKGLKGWMNGDNITTESCEKYLANT